MRRCLVHAIPMLQPGLRLAVTGLCLLAVGSWAGAGGGPENVLLLVNVNSESSRTIANHYIRWRRLPAANVLYVDWQGSLEKCTGEQFRQKLLNPALETIRKRRLSLQIDYLIYSSDFPWQVDLAADFPGTTLPRNMKPLASLTGATFLWQYVQTKNPGVVLTHSNWYLSPGGNNAARCIRLGRSPSRGFRYFYLWTKDGIATGDTSLGQRYLLSTMLGVTSGRGNRVTEVLSYLHRATLADATHPGGTFYFLQNKGPRSKPRHACFQEVAGQLIALGVQAKVINGGIPKDRSDVLGITSGLASFNLEAARTTLLPGGIGDNLTSYGGVLREKSPQTPLTDWLRAGAAGACGTVTEPFAMQAKFPLPSLPLHYVRGCSLAESFYQSISGPYQLLIVGDPLCQPWATPPVVDVEGVSAGDQVSGSLKLRPSATPAPGRKVRFFELYLDGRLHARARPEQELSIDTTALADGHHELRIVAVNQGAIETQGRLIVPLTVSNQEAALTFSVEPSGTVSADTTLRLSAEQPGAQRLVFRQNSRELGSVAGPAGQVEVRAGDLGRGPVALEARGEGANRTQSAPVWLEIR